MHEVLKIVGSAFNTERRLSNWVCIVGLIIVYGGDTNLWRASKNVLRNLRRDIPRLVTLIKEIVMRKDPATVVLALLALCVPPALIIATLLSFAQSLQAQL